ncbi:MAG: SRPBCC family protein [Gammaproteobacteria bacterium]|nr:SRPBCC family protein [Gammaproteobacteria bacterium]
MAEFKFVTVWRIEAPLVQVCDAISHCRHWPNWWKAVEKVEIFESGGTDGVGSLRRFTWKGWLPYRLTFDLRVTRAVPLMILEGYASGEVEGIGRWYFFNDGVMTIVRYEWHVRTNRRWMNLIAPFAWPLFKWNHDYVMRQGGKGLARLLNARLVSQAHD